MYFYLVIVILEIEFFILYFLPDNAIFSDLATSLDSEHKTSTHMGDMVELP